MTKAFKVANAATRENLSSEILQKQLQTAFAARQFSALVSIDGIDSNTDAPFHYDFIFNMNDPEFVAMLNDYGARLAGKKHLQAFRPVTAEMPADGALCEVLLKSDEALQLYRFKGEWFDQLGFHHRGPVPVEFKIAQSK